MSYIPILAFNSMTFKVHIFTNIVFMMIQVLCNMMYIISILFLISLWVPAFSSF